MYVRAMEWACNEKENAVIFSLKKVCKWRNTTWWHSAHTRMIKGRSRKPHKMEAKVGGGTIEEMCGI